MARTSQTRATKRGGRRNTTNNTRNTRNHKENDLEYMALKQEAERRERILADRRRTAAKWRPKIPEVRKVNFENFKNRFQDIDEPDYAIDVLMSGTGTQAQIRREHGLRRREEMARLRQKYMYYPGGGVIETPHRKTDAYEKARREKDSQPSSDSEIQRIRIQSQPILGHLTALMNDTEKRSSPRTFMRPFKTLVHFQPKMREILATLEDKWADFEDIGSESSEVVDVAEETEAEVVDEEEAAEDGDDVTSQTSEASSIESVDSDADEDYDNLMDSPEALRDMRCYVDFVDKEVLPLYNRFEGSTADRVKFDDLWSLFRVGDLIYMPASGETGGRYHEIWRVYKVRSPEPETSYPTSGWDFFADEQQIDENSKFKISAYYIDHDGNTFGAVRRKFEIESFIGERSIDSLEAFPIRYRHDYKQLLSSMQDQGRKFINYLDDRHQQYSAWTLTRNPPSHRTEPEEEILDNEDYEKMRHPEFVESDVIVDLTEAYQKMPDWRPRFHQLTINKSSRCEIKDDEMPIQHWFNGTRQNMAYSQNEIIQHADGVEARQRRDNLAVDAFLRVRVKGSRTFETNPKALELRDEDLILLPKRMFAYALRERRFLPIDLNVLKPVRREPGVFENLRIQSDYKDVVRGLVMSHFQRKVLERKYADAATEGPSQDLIQGKGRGLVVLLHGVPGVGKTATAEAVAMENRKPLFVITCGDLGLTPHEVESSLKNVFRLAHLWDCVLLLDEADVFLSQRSKQDMKRNALVSVFLRVLEYYNGLLFLTTNRVGTIDEAFKSRIHLSLYYPPLDKTQTRDIFRLNIGKLKQIEAERHRMTGEPALVIKENEIIDFAAKHYEELARSTGCWNGRQIRSAFQIASSLAIHNYANQAEAARSRGQSPPAAPVLDRNWFEKVQMSTQSFDRHMKKEAGSYDSEMPMRSTFQESKFD
ncbi:related to TOB3 (member of AAA-ATPase family) [Fusarium oxysporum]|uniref:Related to TOB3 (Member of AAA-ATPase family) n=1 Tax=Fusarium oxysporum TaxID=5507 RepID=A0A2H3U9R3_FUSOX|nr:related to TOB3 (member of AAA-ATPase family) [Fusarium oxysporum]